MFRIDKYRCIDILTDKLMDRYKKKDFKESSFDCNEIKYKLKKYTKRLLSGGSKKLKTKNKIHNKRCISKQCLERYSRRKI